MNSIQSITNLQTNYEGKVKDYLTRFLAFALPYAAHFKELCVEEPDKATDLSEIDTENVAHLKQALGNCVAALGRMETERLNSEDKEEQQSDYAVQIRAFAREGANLYTQSIETVIVMGKHMIKQSKDTLKKADKDRNLYYNNPKLRQIKSDMEKFIKEQEQLLIVNQMELAELKLLSSDINK
jgi:hypothetical protein